MVGHAGVRQRGRFSAHADHRAVLATSQPIRCRIARSSRPRRWAYQVLSGGPHTRGAGTRPHVRTAPCGRAQPQLRPNRGSNATHYWTASSKSSERLVIWHRTPNEIHRAVPSLQPAIPAGDADAHLEASPYARRLPMPRSARNERRDTVTRDHSDAYRRDVADSTVPTGTVAIPNGFTKLSLLLDEDAPFV
jgi:hypothetical protein